MKGASVSTSHTRKGPIGLPTAQSPESMFFFFFWKHVLNRSSLLSGDSSFVSRWYKNIQNSSYQSSELNLKFTIAPFTDMSVGTTNRELSGLCVCFRALEIEPPASASHVLVLQAWVTKTWLKYRLVTIIFTIIVVLIKNHEKESHGVCVYVCVCHRHYEIMCV